MDENLQQAVATEAEEERQLQEAIRLSLEGHASSSASTATTSTATTSTATTSTATRSMADQLRETSARRKRNPEEELSQTITKTARLSPPTLPIMTYPNGGIRITRTPGRKRSKNCINLGDLILKESLVSACVFSFFIADEELFPYLPLSHSSDAVPIYIGRDANMDSTVHAACAERGIEIKGKINSKQLKELTPRLGQINHEQYGKNFHSFYAWSSGSSHSKILILLYEEFLRVVITSCNMMDIDTKLGDNHWYIHDLPKRPRQEKEVQPGFEADLISHLQALGTPEAFIDSIRGMYDYTTVKVKLVTSVPGTHSGPKAETYGLLRLRRVVQDLDLSLPEKKNGGTLRLEVCTASIGNLSAKWLDSFYDCALGNVSISVQKDSYTVPDIELFYPTTGDVNSAHESAKLAASNIGCHTRPWDEAPHAIKRLFRHYKSKDSGRLFHQKIFLAYDVRDEAVSQPPYYIYIGSGNLSASAWGTIEPDKSKKSNDETCKTKIKIINFECGVMVPGHLIPGLLEPGTKDWRDGIVPYVQSTERYDLSKDKAWNDVRWVKDYQETRD